MVINFKQPLLPFDFSEVGGAGIDKYEKSLPRKSKFSNMNLLYGLGFCGDSQMPRVKGYSGDISEEIVSFSMAKTSRNYNAAVHFYIFDYEFECLWNTPFRYLNLLSKYKFVIGPDYSQYLNCPHPVRIWNNYRNKVLMAWLQDMGVTVIPNVTWSDPYSYAYCFEGLPSNSIISINSMGALRDPVCRNLWLRGYREALEVLHPIHIIRYGKPIPGENKEISTYFDNDNLKKLHNGR